MDMLTQAAPALVGTSIVLVVVFCEIIKKIDKQERLKCARHTCLRCLPRCLRGF